MNPRSGLSATTFASAGTATLKQVHTWIGRSIRECGVLGTLCYLLNKLCRRCFGDRVRVHLYRLQVLPVREHKILPPHRGRQFELREVHRDDPVLETLPRPATVIQNRYAQGSRCYCAFHNQVAVGQLWLQFESYLEDEVRSRFKLVPAREVAWDYDVYVDPHYRLTPLFARLWDEAFTQLRGAGKSWCASRVSAWNTASLQAHNRMGAQNVGAAFYFIIGRLQLMLASVAPYVHVSVSDNFVPVLEIQAPRRPGTKPLLAR